MLTDNPRTRERGHLGDSATLCVLPWQLDDHGPLARDWVLEDLSGLNLPEVRRGRRIGMRHAPILMPPVDCGARYQWSAANLLSPYGKPCRHADADRDTTPREAPQAPLDQTVRAIHTKGAVVIYLIVGLDSRTHARWHENVSADDIGTAKRIAEARAAAQGLDLVVAAVIGANSAVVSDPADRPTARLRAA